MVATVESSCYHLVTYGRDEDAILIFFDSDAPADAGYPPSTPVILELLPPGQRFGFNGGVAMGRPFLGCWPNSTNRFRQFLTHSEMVEAGWVQVPRYRICDSWDDYFSPWTTPGEQQTTVRGLFDDLGIDETAASRSSIQ